MSKLNIEQLPDTEIGNYLALKMVDAAIEHPEIIQDIKVGAYFVVITPKPNQAYGIIEIRTDRINLGRLEKLANALAKKSSL